MKNRKTTDKIKDRLFSKVGVRNVEENQENIERNSNSNNRLVDAGIELDNSSFSLDKNAKRYEDLTNFNKQKD